MKFLKDNSIWVALAAAAALGAFLFIDLKKPVKEPGEMPKVEELAGVKPDEVTRVEIKKDKAPIVLARSGKDWSLESPAKGRADSDEVKRILDSLLASSSDYILENAKDLKQYRLDPPEFEVVLSAGNEKHTLQFGMQDPAKSSVYTRDVESNKVFLASSAGVDSLRSKTAADFRDRTLVGVDADKIRSITLQKPAGIVKLTRREQDKWRLIQPWDAPADNTTISGLTSTLAGMKADKFVAAGVQDASRYGLISPMLVIIVEGDGKAGIRVGKKAAGKPEYYVSPVGSHNVLTISEGTFQSINRTAKDLRSKKVIDFDSANVDRINIKGPKGSWEVERSGSEWKIVKPDPGTKVSTEKIDNLLLDLGTPAVAHIEESSPLIGKYGLDDPPKMTVTLFMNDVPKKHILVGDNKTNGGGYYAMGTDSVNTVFEISTFTFDNINKRPEELR
jgi:hypothetical protein